ncbi:MAG: SulP family inorganic anion transporter [Xanthobacteraceae bacterium]
MAFSALTGKQALSARSIHVVGRDLLAGLVCGVLSLAFGLSFAALIFSGPLAPWLAYGIAASFIASSVAALVVALGSTLPFSIAGPDSSTSAVTAALVASVTQHLAAAGASDRLLVAALIVMPMSSALTGLALCGLGLARGGRAIRFVPYPVIGGFLGATGVLVVSGACHVVIDHPLTFADSAAFLLAANATKLAAAAAVGMLLFLTLRRIGNAAVTPAVLLVCALLAYAVMAATGTSLDHAEVSGWMFKISARNVLDLPWHSDELNLFPWQQLPALTGDLIAVMFVTVISTLLNMTGIEYATHHEASLNRELNTLGVANLCSAVFGGYTSCISLSRTVLNHSMGARTRLSGVVVAALCAFVLTIDPTLLGYVPKFVLGGLLLYLGGMLIYQWLMASALRLSVAEYLSLLAIAAIIVEWGFIAGVLSGVVIGCATFALSASRINAIKYSFDGSEIRSSLDRSPDELAVLTRDGSQIQVMALHSYLFFGSANGLHEHIKTLLARHPECRFLVFDFRLVNGVDSSATHSFSQIKRAADDRGARVVLVNLTPELGRAFRAIGFLTDDILLVPDLDQALETCEDAIIEAAQRARGEAKSLHEWLAEAFGNAEYADFLVKQCVRMEVAPGDVIARQGDPADALHFILDGRIGILVDAGDHQIRVRSLRSHTTVGEMGLITGQPRNATIRAETPGVLYALSLGAYERTKVENPAAALALLGYIITVMSERLSFANRVVGVLQR